jgi:uncharacterized membrane protein YdjX (TVP38/TMEM64 family)
MESILGLYGNVPVTHEDGLLLLGAICLIGALTFIPRIPACIVGGLVFGFAAVPVALVGSTAGALIAFLLSRYLLRARIAKLVDRRPTWKLFLNAVDAEGWRLLGLLRLASPVPGSASNYAFGLTRIGVFPYLAATFFGSAPQVFAFVYLGAASRSALDPDSVSTAKLLFTLAGCALTLVAVHVTVRRVKSLLSVKLRCGSDLQPGET